MRRCRVQNHLKGGTFATVFPDETGLGIVPIEKDIHQALLAISSPKKGQRRHIHGKFKQCHYYLESLHSFKRRPFGPTKNPLIGNFNTYKQGIKKSTFALAAKLRYKKNGLLRYYLVFQLIITFFFKTQVTRLGSRTSVFSTSATLSNTAHSPSHPKRP